MLNYFKAFFIFLLWAAIALTFHFYNSSTCLFSRKNLKKTTPTIAFIVTNTTNDTIFKNLKGFTIIENSPQVLNISNFTNLKDTLKYYLRDYSKELQIVGKFLKQEMKLQSNKNIGLQRAKFVKKEFINAGINSEKIKVLDRESSYFYNKNGKYTNGIDLKIQNLKPTDIDSIETLLTTKILYIKFDGNTIVPDKNVEEYTFNLKQYLQKYPTKNIAIIGHTDNLGYYDKNLVVGLNRANKVKEYFASKGIDLNKIKTSSKGESEPIADKTTEEGRAKNRRIEIKIN